MIINNLSKSFSEEILHDVKFRLDSNKVYSLLGRNGVGKTTLLKIISNLMEYDSGSIDSNGKSVFFVPETPQFLDYLSGYENLRFLCEIQNIPIVNLENYLKDSNIKSFVDELVINYSHGMKHQLSLASAFLISPDILLLDEPLTSLDPINIEIFKRMLREFADKDKTVLISTHIIPIAHQLSDEILLLSNKQIRQLKNNYTETELTEYVTNNI